MSTENLKIKKKKITNYNKMYPQAGQRSNEGMRQMKVKLALLAGLIVLGAVGAHIIEGFKN